MNKFDSYEELLESIGMNKKDVYAHNQLADYLGCEGSCDGENGKEPNVVFVLEHEGVSYQVGVTHQEVAEDEFEYTYWIE